MLSVRQRLRLSSNSQSVPSNTYLHLLLLGMEIFMPFPTFIYRVSLPFPCARNIFVQHLQIVISLRQNVTAPRSDVPFETILFKMVFSCRQPNFYIYTSGIVGLAQGFSKRVTGFLLWLEITIISSYERHFKPYLNTQTPRYISKSYGSKKTGYVS